MSRSPYQRMEKFIVLKTFTRSLRHDAAFARIQLCQNLENKKLFVSLLWIEVFTLIVTSVKIVICSYHLRPKATDATPSMVISYARDATRRGSKHWPHLRYKQLIIMHFICHDIFIVKHTVITVILLEYK